MKHVTTFGGTLRSEDRVTIEWALGGKVKLHCCEDGSDVGTTIVLTEAEARHLAKMLVRVAE